jgi:hypothetical protein
MELFGSDMTWRKVGRAVLIGLATVVVVAPLAIPDLGGGCGYSRLRANESAAISALRKIATAQDEFRAAAWVDEDGDGVGEAGTFLEMSGAAVLRGFAARRVTSIESGSSEVEVTKSPRDAESEPEQAVDPLTSGGTGETSRPVPGALRVPVLSGAFRVIDERGAVSRCGYHFRIFLPGADGSSVTETRDAGLPDDATDPEPAEGRWSAYAWPASPASGRRAFFVNETGAIFAVTRHRYRGVAGPEGAAAERPANSDADRAPLKYRGRDGNDWSQVK